MAKKTLTEKMGKRGGGSGGGGVGGSGAGGRGGDGDGGEDDPDFDPLLAGELSRCNSYDFDVGADAANAAGSAAATAAPSGAGSGIYMTLKFFIWFCACAVQLFTRSFLFSGRGSAGAATAKDSGGSLCLQERHMVPTEAVRVGMGRFAFLLETCTPGSVPDPLLIAALLDLPKAPVITRACYLLECANFVHQCNRGQWPAWLKMNLPAYRPSRGQVLSTQPVQRRLQILQLQASKSFYQWAEMLSCRLEEKILQEQQVVAMVTDESRQRQLLLEDELEDFLDEASVNASGCACPHALKLVACLLLLEITTFLRECYRTLPKPVRGQSKTSHFWGGAGAAEAVSAAAAVRGVGGAASGAGGVSIATVAVVATSAASGASGGAAGGGPSQQSASGRRWSMAAQSLAGGQSTMSQAAAAVQQHQHQHLKQIQQPPSTPSMPATTPPAEATPSELSLPPSAPNSAGMGPPEIPPQQQRKISFVLQDDIQAVNGGALPVRISFTYVLGALEFPKFLFRFSFKVEEEKRGARITQGKPFLKRGPSQHSQVRTKITIAIFEEIIYQNSNLQQGSFRRRSIRLRKSEERQNSVSSSTGITSIGSRRGPRGSGGSREHQAVTPQSSTAGADGDTECKSLCLHIICFPLFMLC